MVLPQAVTITSSDQQTVAPLTNMLNDEMAMVWRSTGTSATIAFTASAPIDTVALVNSNLAADDTVRIRAGDDDSVNGYDSGALPAWGGSKADWITAKTIVRFDALENFSHWRIDIVSPGNPDGFIQVARLVVGEALSHVGVDSDAELSMLDQSDVTQGPGWQSYVEYATVPVWKVSFDQVVDATFMTKWFDFFGQAGNRRAILFVPDDQTPEYKQNMAVFGNMTGENVGKHPLSDMWSIEITVRARAA